MKEGKQIVSGEEGEFHARVEAGRSEIMRFWEVELESKSVLEKEWQPGPKRLSKVSLWPLLAGIMDEAAKKTERTPARLERR